MTRKHNLITAILQTPLLLYFLYLLLYLSDWIWTHRGLKINAGLSFSGTTLRLVSSDDSRPIDRTKLKA